jgi:hypothetical protein
MLSETLPPAAPDERDPHPRAAEPETTPATEGDPSSGTRLLAALAALATKRAQAMAAELTHDDAGEAGGAHGEG